MAMEGLVCGIDKKIPREKQGWRQRRRATFAAGRSERPGGEKMP